jgi:hypothetical protein
MAVDIKRNKRLIEMSDILTSNAANLKKLVDEYREEVTYTQNYYPLKRLLNNYSEILYKVKYCIKDL